MLKSDLGQLKHYANRATSALNIDYPVPPDQPPYIINLQTQTISYTSHHKARTISEVVDAINHEVTYTYGPDQQRRTSARREQGQLKETRTYVGDYEKQVVDGVTREIHYVSGGDGLCAMLVREGGNTKLYYVFKDHLGSIIKVVEASGFSWSVVAEQNFDAWGRRRKPSTWEHDDVPSGPSWLYRGYTGHEHVEPFRLINMNGRMYDPLNARMLSADPVVASEYASQAFNRYSYAFNNPLKYTDPDGRLPFLLVPLTFFVGSMLESVLNNGMNQSSLQTGWQAYNRASAGLSSVTSLQIARWQSGNFSGELRVGLAFGSSTGVGLSSTVTYSDGSFTTSIGGSLYGYAHTYGPSGLRFEGTIGGSMGWSDGNGFFNIYSTTFFSKGTSQSVGGVSVGGAGWAFGTENDFLPGGDGGDRFRTAGAYLKVGEFSARLRLFTGDPLEQTQDAIMDDGRGEGGLYVNPSANLYRAGVLSLGYGGVEYGINSEGVRHLFQNRLIHDNFLDWFGRPSPWFERLPGQFPATGHYQIGPQRPFTLW